MGHHEVTLDPEQVTFPQDSLLGKLPMIGGGMMVALLAAFAMGLGGEHKVEFLYAYLFAWMFWATFAIGGLWFVMLHHLVRAGWSVVVRRLAEHVAMTMPVIAVLFAPVIIFHHDIYHWAHPVEELDAILQQKVGWLNSGFWTGRSIGYLAVWCLLAWYFSKKSIEQDESGDEGISRTLMTRSAVGMALFAVSLNFAAFDWIMSLDPHWFSTAFGVYVFAGCVVTIMATLIILSLQLQSSGKLQGVITWEHFHDLGKLLFAFTVFWAYIGYSQFMLIWYANIPEETAWFDHRWEGGGSWQTISILLAVCHFGVPFLFLLFSDVKRRRGTLLLASFWLLFWHMMDMYWLVMPNIALVNPDAHGFHPTLFDALCIVGIGGGFLVALGLRFRGRNLVPVQDPRLAESLAFEQV